MIKRRGAIIKDTKIVDPMLEQFSEGDIVSPMVMNDVDATVIFGRVVAVNRKEHKVYVSWNNGEPVKQHEPDEIALTSKKAFQVKSTRRMSGSFVSVMSEDFARDCGTERVASGYSISLKWQGLSGKQGEIGSFVVSEKVLDRIEDEFEGQIVVDVHKEVEDSSSESSYKDVMKSVIDSEYGKVIQETVKKMKKSSDIVSGGGAGISFENLDVDFSRCQFFMIRRGESDFDAEVKGLPVIKKFDASGYMDGDSNVSGRNLKVTGFDFEGSDDMDLADEFVEVASDWFPEVLEERKVELDVDSYEIIDDMVFAGYQRGNFSKQALQFECVLYLMVNGGKIGPCRFVLDAEPTSQGVKWYKSVFAGDNINASRTQTVSVIDVKKGRILDEDIEAEVVSNRTLKTKAGVYSHNSVILEGEHNDYGYDETLDGYDYWRTY